MNEKQRWYLKKIVFAEGNDINVYGSEEGQIVKIKDFKNILSIALIVTQSDWKVTSWETTVQVT